MRQKGLHGSGGKSVAVEKNKIKIIKREKGKRKEEEMKKKRRQEHCNRPKTKEDTVSTVPDSQDHV